MKRRSIGLLTVGHIFTDINQGALAALLPFLIIAHNLSYASAACLVFAANASSSIIQPLFGSFADKISAPWIIPLGVFVAGFGIAIAGVVPNYWLIFVAVAISGIGIAAFHPEAARVANSASGDKKGAGVSTFTAGGHFGFAIGPVITTAILSTFGLKGSLLLIIPMAIMAGILFMQLPYISTEKKDIKQNKKQVLTNENKDEWNSFLRLLGAITFRSIIFFGLNTFLPLYWINVLHQQKSAGSTALTILLISGATGSLIAGRLADNYGHRNIVKISFAALAPLLIIFVHVTNVTMATLLLIPVGFALFSPFSPMVVLGQKYLPNHMGLASGVTLGLAVSIGGTFAPALGWLADHYGILTALNLIAFLPILATLAALFLPTPQIDLLNNKLEHSRSKMKEAVSQ